MFKKIGAFLAGAGALVLSTASQAAVTIDTAAITSDINDGATSAGTIASVAIGALAVLVVISIIVAVIKKF